MKLPHRTEHVGERRDIWGQRCRAILNKDDVIEAFLYGHRVLPAVATRVVDEGADVHDVRVALAVVVGGGCLWVAGMSCRQCPPRQSGCAPVRQLTFSKEP